VTTSSPSPLVTIEPRLRALLPADLYAAAWVDPVPSNLMRVFEHLRTLQRILHDYVPRHVAQDPPTLGQVRYHWQEGTLMFTDLAGFTPLMEANAARGREGAETLLGVLNNYFAGMIEVISKSGGNLLEFTGDAMLAVFPTGRFNDVAQAVRAGLRMQRAMRRFASIETAQGVLSLGMRIGLHTGRFLTADIGTPRRMEHILLGASVRQTKYAEGSGKVGRVNLTLAAYERVKDQFHFESGEEGHMLVVDDLSTSELGEYDLRATRRSASTLLLERSVEGLVREITEAVKLVEPLASYLPQPILNLLVETASRRRIVPDFPEPTVMFVNLVGLAQSVDEATQTEEAELVAAFSQAFALINAVIEARGGVLKNVTYHLAGSDMMVYFGAINAHTNDPARAADAALAIRDIVTKLPPLQVGGQSVAMSCQIGLARGAAFAGEIGEPRGRREFNVLGDTVNTAARLMGKASKNQILLTEMMRVALSAPFEFESLGTLSLKGKAKAVQLFELVK